jgi:hypothetical protein
MQIRDRGGSIEITVASDSHDDGGRDLIWRVKVLDITDNEIIVEQPVTLGQTVDFQSGVRMVGYMTVGQNRWMFHSQIISQQSAEHYYGRSAVMALHMKLPASVERCKRRNYFRLSTEHLELPKLEAWPLLDPSSVMLAERAIEVRLKESNGESHQHDVMTEEALEHLLPDLGPKFTAILMNIGGGGLGLLVEPDNVRLLTRCNALWLRLQLPGMEAPICAVGRVVHSHIESTQQTYAGIAFDFSFNPANQLVVADLICRYISMQQNNQLRQSA